MRTMMLRGWIPWWWPVIAMRRWNGRGANSNRGTSEHRQGERSIVARDDGPATGEGDPSNADDAHDDEVDDGMTLHRGSCHCGSIKFVVRSWGPDPSAMFCMDDGPCALIPNSSFRPFCLFVDVFYTMNVHAAARTATPPGDRLAR